MLSKLWKWIAGALGGIALALGVLAKVRGRQLDNAREEAEEQEQRAATAEKRIEQRHKADTASKQAKEEGEKRVEEAVTRARSGRRDHFE